MVIDWRKVMCTVYMYYGQIKVIDLETKIKNNK